MGKQGSSLLGTFSSFAAGFFNTSEGKRLKKELKKRQDEIKMLSVEINKKVEKVKHLEDEVRELEERHASDVHDLAELDSTIQQRQLIPSVQIPNHISVLDREIEDERKNRGIIGLQADLEKMRAENADYSAAILQKIRDFFNKPTAEIEKYLGAGVDAKSIQDLQQALDAIGTKRTEDDLSKSLKADLIARAENDIEKVDRVIVNLDIDDQEWKRFARDNPIFFMILKFLAFYSEERYLKQKSVKVSEKGLLRARIENYKQEIAGLDADIQKTFEVEKQLKYLQNVVLIEECIRQIADLEAEYIQPMQNMQADLRKDIPKEERKVKILQGERKRLLAINVASGNELDTARQRMAAANSEKDNLYRQLHSKEEQLLVRIQAIENNSSTQIASNKGKSSDDETVSVVSDSSIDSYEDEASSEATATSADSGDSSTPSLGRNSIFPAGAQPGKVGPIGSWFDTFEHLQTDVSRLERNHLLSKVRTNAGLDLGRIKQVVMSAREHLQGLAPDNNSRSHLARDAQIMVRGCELLKSLESAVAKYSIFYSPSDVAVGNLREQSHDAVKSALRELSSLAAENVILAQRLPDNLDLAGFEEVIDKIQELAEYEIASSQSTFRPHYRR